ncbi:hypothetical protein F5880DRAFT_1572444 [Lentinula raphanica]|nr:hypothetical protein F5880DRAFT_1572444 [Lentinula raphanica]
MATDSNVPETVQPAPAPAPAAPEPELTPREEIVPDHRRFSHMERVDADEFSVKPYRDSERTIWVTPQQVRAFCECDDNLREDGTKIVWMPLGYLWFAHFFNRTTTSQYRFSYLGIDSKGREVVYNTEYAGPPKDFFGVKPYQCFRQGEYRRPHHVEVPEDEFNRLKETVVKNAETATLGRVKAERARLAKRENALAQSRYNEGTFHFVKKFDEDYRRGSSSKRPRND